MSAPSLALPILAGYATAHGFPVRQRDINAEFHQFLFDTGALERLAATLEAEAEAAPATERMPHLRDAMEARFFANQVSRPALLFGQGRRLAKLLPRLDPRLGQVPLGIRSSSPFLLGEGSPYDGFFTETLWPGIKDRDELIVGFSLAIKQQILPALWLARLFHQLGIGVYVVLGGPVINLLDESNLCHLGAMPWVQGIVHFGGAETFLALLRALDAGVTHQTIPSLIDCCQPTPTFPATSVLPEIREGLLVAFDRRLLAQYPDSEELPVLVSTGCYWGRCTFCSYVNVSQHENLILQPSELVAHLEGLVAGYGCRRFRLITESLSPAYCEELASLILACGLKVHFRMFMRIDKGFNRRRIQLLAKAGLYRVQIGVESTLPRILKLMRKGYTRQMIFTQLECLREAMIAQHLNFIFDYPGTTQDEALMMLQDLKELTATCPDLEVQPFALLQGTPLAGDPERHGLVLADTFDPFDMEEVLGAIPYRDRYGMTPEEKRATWTQYDELAREIMYKVLHRMLLEVNPKTWTPQMSLRSLSAFIRAYTLLENRTDAPGGRLYNLFSRQVHLLDTPATKQMQALGQNRLGLQGFVAAQARALGRTEAEVSTEVLSLLQTCILPNLRLTET